MSRDNDCMIKKINSEKSVDNSIFKLKFGTTNKSNPATVYLEGSTFITPLVTKTTYEQNLAAIKKDFSLELRKKLQNDSIYSDRFLFIIESAHDRMKCNKKSFFYFQCHLRPHEIHKFDKLKEMSKDVIDDMTQTLASIITANGFSVSKTKK